MAEPVRSHVIPAGETYQLDSDDFDSGPDDDDVEDEEYAALVDEAENGYTDDEMKAFTHDLKERGLITFLRSYLLDSEGEERSLRKLLLGFGVIPPAPIRDPRLPNLALLPYTKLVLSRILRRRLKLPQYNSVSDAIDLLKNAKNIIVLSGAGISTSCGIPDFRSSTGLYAGLQAEGKYELDDPQQMFDIHYFREHPEVFFSFAKQIYPSNFVPSPCHRWIKLLEDRGALLRNYTQNIDTLESLAGVTKVLQCHGSFATASCLRCKTQVPGQSIESYIMSSQIPYCGTCRETREKELAQLREQKAKLAASKGKGKAKATEWDDSDDDDEDVRLTEWGGGEPGIIKPDITFFGQALDSKFDESLFRDRDVVDLLVIMGTSLKVAPVSEVLSHIPHSVPQIYINLTPVTHVQPDISLLGDADTIVTYLSNEVGWSIPPPPVVLHPPSSPSKIKAEVGSQEVLSSNGNDKSDGTMVSPEDVAWRSGVGPLSHIHFLTSKAELAADPDRPMFGLHASTANDSDSDDSSMKDEGSDEEKRDLEEIERGEEEGRPAKRSRKGSSDS